ncbi:cytochrome c biogenesis heme-transporting ATPase CcmA [Gilvimarinus sp. F26214L]|uniref:cytochrome c biogenesis heme-transporting ATPase CcmA n=1 Tax=Gilvimarinus sp. DZF01 TaxID=3461371 RepID=UPI0040467502
MEGRVETEALELRNLACERDGRILFSGLDLTVSSGEILQVHGPNGSGKTTLLRILTGISSDFEGSVQWCGTELHRNRFDYHRNLLYIGHLPGVKRALTPEENLAWYCGLSGGAGREAIGWALAEVGLAGYEDVPSHQLSAGQHRRVALARLYLSGARVWILDEPFTAIDVQGVTKLRDLFSRHVKNGGLLILTTHQDLGMEQVKLLNLLDFAGVQ